jgi:hypothetical protein
MANLPRPDRVAKQRPAESATTAGAISFLVARLLGLKDEASVTAFGTLVGFMPSAATWLIETAKSMGLIKPPSPYPEELEGAMREIGQAFAKAARQIADEPDLATKLQELSALATALEHFRGTAAPGTTA